MSANTSQGEGKASRVVPGKRDGSESRTDRMKRYIDSDQGKRMIAARFATIETVFGNLPHNKRLDRFTLGGHTKVDG